MSRRQMKVPGMKVPGMKVPGTKKRPMPDHKLMCVLVGAPADAVVAVNWYAERRPRDSGYLIFTSSAPRHADDATEDDYGTYCLACLRKRHPEAEGGLTLAKAYGFAYWDEDEGGWVAEDEGNEVVFDDGDEPPQPTTDPETFDQ